MSVTVAAWIDALTVPDVTARMPWDHFIVMLVVSHDKPKEQTLGNWLADRWPLAFHDRELRDRTGPAYAAVHFIQEYVEY